MADLSELTDLLSIKEPPPPKNKALTAEQEADLFSEAVAIEAQLQFATLIANDLAVGDIIQVNDGDKFKVTKLVSSACVEVKKMEGRAKKAQHKVELKSGNIQRHLRQLMAGRVRTRIEDCVMLRKFKIGVFRSRRVAISKGYWCRPLLDPPPKKP